MFKIRCRYRDLGRPRINSRDMLIFDASNSIEGVSYTFSLEFWILFNFEAWLDAIESSRGLARLRCIRIKAGWSWHHISRLVLVRLFHILFVTEAGWNESWCFDSISLSIRHFVWQYCFILRVLLVEMFFLATEEWRKLFGVNPRACKKTSSAARIALRHPKHYGRWWIW